jgi:hypothetical protein
MSTFDYAVFIKHYRHISIRHTSGTLRLWSRRDSFHDRILHLRVNMLPVIFGTTISSCLHTQRVCRSNFLRVLCRRIQVSRLWSGDSGQCSQSAGRYCKKSSWTSMRRCLPYWPIMMVYDVICDCSYRHNKSCSIYYINSSSILLLRLNFWPY